MSWRKSSALFVSGLLGSVLFYGASVRGEDKKYVPIAAHADYDKEIKPLLDKYCDACHGAKKQSGGINLSGFDTPVSLGRNQDLWRHVLTQVREHTMPPEGKPQPDVKEREKLVEWLKATLDSFADSAKPTDPGRKIIHRLNRLEYNNTVRDLLGVTSNPADKFPADGGGGGGFDNNADTLFVPPILMERYLEAADEVLKEASPEKLFIVRPDKKRNPEIAARLIIERLGSRAFRRPLEKPENERLMKLYNSAVKRGDKWEDAIKLAVKAILISPHFLFRIEREQKGDKPYPVNDYELASRLSYFLWASMPDGELLGLAAKKKLRDPKILEAQVKRLIADPKFNDTAQSFSGQWLHTRELHGVSQPDPKKFPTFTPALKKAMEDEVTQFFASIVRENKSLFDLLDADYTYVNEELAKHYKIEGISGEAMRRVNVEKGKRGGVLTTAAVLTITSYPQRTSPVLRGKWVLEEILGTPPPPPPPNAGALPANDAVKDGLTFRQRLEEHRKDPNCAGCHARMDPIGFGLENYDPIGRWRDEIGGAPVDAAGVLASGEKFTGPTELKAHLQKRRDDFARNLTEKMLAYALGRGLEPGDVPSVRAISKKLAANDFRTQTLMLEIVQSYPFQFRKN
ncbi:MAG TPA: DUF1592 domain-containing protein [Abditibacteriaceae bacterium]|jgi:hypothetical protein